MNSKIYQFFNTLYDYLKVSFFWWIYLFRGAVVYGFLPAGCALVYTVEELLHKKESSVVSELFKKYYNQFIRYKGQSFLFSIILVSSWFLLFLLNRINGTAAIIGTIVIIYVMALTLIVYSYLINFLSTKDISFKQAFARSYIAVFKMPKTTFTILLVLLGMVTAAYINFAFFFFFGPFLYGIALRFILQNSLRQER
jgi:uncharacterized membrane protein YesL